MTKADAGRIGGIITSQRHGHDDHVKWGKQGGRPKSPNYEDIRQQQLLEQNNKKEVMGSPGNLKQQKKLFAARQRSNGVLVTSNEEAGITQVTPRERVPAGKEAR